MEINATEQLPPTGTLGGSFSFTRLLCKVNLQSPNWIGDTQFTCKSNSL